MVRIYLFLLESWLIKTKSKLQMLNMVYLFVKIRCCSNLCVHVKFYRIEDSIKDSRRTMVSLGKSFLTTDRSFDLRNSNISISLSPSSYTSLGTKISNPCLLASYLIWSLQSRALLVYLFPSQISSSWFRYMNYNRNVYYPLHSILRSLCTNRVK